MTLEDAKMVLEIMVTAHSNCQECTRRLFTNFVKTYPDHLLSAKFVYRKTFALEFEYDEYDTSN